MKLPLLPIAIMTLFALSGCKSTSNNLPIVNGEVVYPSMPLLEKEPFVWDNNVSEAFNVVRMAQPAGIAVSLRDFDDGKNASIGRIGEVEGLIEGTLGLYSSGLFTVVQMGALRSGVNSLVMFQPTIVDVVDEELVSNNGEISYMKARNHLAKKVMTAIELKHPEIKWGGVYSLYNGDEKFDMQLIIEDEPTCKSYRQLRTGDENVEPLTRRNFADIFVDGEDRVRDYCLIGFHINAPVKTSDGKVALVAEMQSGAYFVESVIDNYEGYVIVPDIYFFNSKHRRAIRADFAYVSKKGDVLMLERPN